MCNEGRSESDQSETEHPTLPPQNQSADDPTIPPVPANGDDATLPPADADTTVAPHQDSGEATIGGRIESFGDYEALEEIARGGMGVVFRARQISLNRVVALKMILAGQLADREEIQRFQIEAEAAAKLDHPGIVPIYDIGSLNGQHYFSMKLIEGDSLSAWASSLADDHERIVELVAMIADAVHHAHQRGILHRDLKPGNVLIDGDGHPIVTDFGLARVTESNQDLTRTGAVVGTPGFMPPEQASGKTATTAVDIYSLGAILYQLLCGRPPHSKGSALDTLMAVINEPPDKPRELNASIDRDLELICLKCLAKSPENRYVSAAAVADDLRAHLASQPLTVRPPSAIELAKIWLANNFGNVVWVPIIALLTGGIAGFVLWTGTLGGDISYDIEMYKKLFPESHSWLIAIDWRPLRNFIIPFLLIMTMGMGWITARLVGTKTSAADIGAGLSVGLLAGLLAFVTGMGPMFTHMMHMENKQDFGWISALAESETSSPSRDSIHEQILQRYPSLKQIGETDRVVRLTEKIDTDFRRGNLVGSWVGAFISLFMFGTLGVLQTMVAGPLLRGSPRFPAVVSYLCFTMGCAAFWFIVGSEATFRLTMGAGYILSWSVAVFCIILSLAAMVSVLRQQRIHWQVFTAAGCLVLLALFMRDSFYGISQPKIALARSAIAKAHTLVVDHPDNRDYGVRLARAHQHFGNLLSQYRRFPQATIEYQAALTVLRERTDGSLLSSSEESLHADTLESAARTALACDRIEQATIWIEECLERYGPSNERENLYARTLACQNLASELIALVGHGEVDDLDSWSRTVRLMRTAVVERDRPSHIEAADPWMNQVVEDVLQSVDDPWQDRRGERLGVRRQLSRLFSDN